MTAVEPLNNPLSMMARVAWQTILLTGILSAVLGVLILAWPSPTRRSRLVAGRSSSD
ncbi:hypothetical protein [Nocardia sp. NPDC004711]